jgi:hypothetical protein
MLVLVCGDRNWSDIDKIRRVLSKLPPKTTIVQGGAKGADTLAWEVAFELGFKVITVEAEWHLGPRAGPIRNRKMLDMNPRFVIAFHNDLKKSRGTADTVREAKRRDIQVVVIE